MSDCGVKQENVEVNTLPRDRRSVQYVLEWVLREAKQSTNFKKAKDYQYTEVFDGLIDMLYDWKDRNYGFFGAIPENEDATLGREDPINAIKFCLLAHCSDYLNYEMTQMQRARAANSLQWIRNRSVCLPVIGAPARQPRGSGNYRWFNGSSYEDVDDVNDEGKYLVNNQGIPLVT